MLKIGDFSKLSRISIRMLRHYNDLDLLIPDVVDDFTGYRYYRESQLPLAEMISVLKSMGFSLTMIKEILLKYENTWELEHFLLIQIEELKEQEAELKRKMLLLDSTIKWLRKDGDIMSYHVTLKTLPERNVASVRRIIPAYEKESLLWQVMMEETAALNLQYGNPAYNLAIFHDGEYKEHDVDVEIQMAVKGDYEDTEHVKFKTIPPVEIASATFKGGYDQITSVNHAVADWVCQNGYELAGVHFCIYHVGMHESRNPDDLVTEVCYPVKKK